ncbi:hypothetical protein [uncultured Roseobacter sp.]|uniref:hypothetical protein n=1 Tax=uncultured Roseobacter sp. TaxID=114847 RepID=UPI0026384BDD|nr:hypothetical protein [uncultured Roseobacter sp.]
MRRKKKAGPLKDIGISAEYLEQSLIELKALCDFFDSGQINSARTISVLCVRILEELKVIDPGEELLIPTFLLGPNNDKPSGIFYLEYSETGAKKARIVSFGPNPYSLMKTGLIDEEFPGLVTRKEWGSQRIFEYRKGPKTSSLRRRDVLTEVRNSLGAHFDERITKLFSQYRDFEPGTQLLFGHPAMDPNKKTLRLNSPFDMLIRSFAGEIIHSMDLGLAKLRLNEIRTERKGLFRNFDQNSMQVHVDAYMEAKANSINEAFQNVDDHIIKINVTTEVALDRKTKRILSQKHPRLQKPS